ncbi:MAG: helix-turn-helix domain-containing protein [Phycisphaerae bacterium]|nr:helix-turn-helix domain-containing protein [Phycisphaerae bacterium]
MSAIDLVFLHGSHTSQCVATVDKHFDGYYVLQYMHSGAITVFYGQQRYDLRGKWFWTDFPGPRIRFHPAEEGGSWDHRYIAFRGRHLERWLAEGIWPAGPIPAPTGRNYDQVMDEVIHLAFSAGRLGRLRAVNLLESVLLDLAEHRGHRKLQRAEWLQRILAVLSDPAAWPYDYDALAADVGMGTSTLRRRFRREMGFPMHHFALQQRIASARTMLLETDAPIKIIAKRLGFRDVYFFTRQFKQITGLSPGTFRKSREM